MADEGKRRALIKAFQAEGGPFSHVTIPVDEEGQRRLLRSIMNVRPAGLPDPEVLDLQDAYLREERDDRGVTHLHDIASVSAHLRLWRGDITSLACDAIVNAANSAMTGCWSPCHSCIDNAIHTFSGVQLRTECDRLMRAQGHPEPVGRAKVTQAYNLPCSHVIHTVGPHVMGPLTREHCERLASSYLACYEAARAGGLGSVAFCCISTGVFGFPDEEAARIALDTVIRCQEADESPLEVVFDVFTDRDEELYRGLLD